uniref:Uncharacterized protein n=1 Tax=Ditylenchus dipsaci TaxID=166011 RepID=A0A915CTY5_9BILA
MGSSHMMLPSNVVCLSFVYWITCFVGCHNLPRSVFEKIWVFRRCTHRGAGRSAYTVRQYYRILQILCGWKMQAGIFYDNGDTQQMAAVGCVFESSGNQLFQANYAMQLTRWGFEQMVLPKVEKAIHSQQKSMSGCFANLALIRKRDQMKTFSKAKNFESTVSVEIYDRLANQYLIDTSGHHIGREKLYRSSTTASEEIPTTESGSQLGDEDFPEDLID